MPLPKPNSEESKNKFLDRCMDNDSMKSEFPDNDQRYAVCLSQWKNKDKKAANMEKREQRSVAISATVEKRSDGALGKISGYAAVFDSDSENMGFVERIAPGAFKKAIKRSKVIGLKNHDPNLVFARQGVNLKINEDDRGLYYEATPVDTRSYRDTAEEIRSGLLTGQSFGFTIQDEEWADLDKETPKRTIKEVREIFDVGPVVYPAYSDTTVALRSLAQAKQATDAARKYTLIDNNIIKIIDTEADETREYNFQNIDQAKRVFNKLYDYLTEQDAIDRTIPMIGADNSNGEPSDPMIDDSSNDENAEPYSIEEIEERFDLIRRRINV